MRNRWDRRDAKRVKARRMKIDGAGTKNLQRIIMEKAIKARQRNTEPSLV